jgi:hypothetical protein
LRLQIEVMRILNPMLATTIIVTRKIKLTILRMLFFFLLMTEPKVQ